MPTNKSLIRNSKQVKQVIDFTGIQNGKIHPSDIDAVLEFNNDALILIEVKRKGNRIPTGQRLLLERISDSWHNQEKAINKPKMNGQRQPHKAGASYRQQHQTGKADKK